MKWYTRRNAHIDRTACPWLIRRWIDPQAEFIFVPSDTDPTTLDGHTFDMRGAEYSHEGALCTFQVLLARNALTDDSALVDMGQIIADADVPPRRGRRPESNGLDAIIQGFQSTTPDDHEKLSLTAPLYDALYAYCRARLAERPATGRAGSRPSLSYTRRVADHLGRDEPSGVPTS